MLIYLWILSLVAHSHALDTSFLHRFFYKSADGTGETSKSNHNDAVAIDFQNHTSRVGIPVCDENKLMLRLAHMQIISPERILLMLLIEHKVDLCHKLKTNIDETTHEMKHCAPFSEDNLYWRLYQGVVVLHRQACTSDTPLTKILTNNELCIRDMREEFVDCEGPAAWFERKDHAAVCQIFDDILECEFVKAAELCGMQVAQMLRCFAKDVFNGSLLKQCDTNIQPPEVKFPMPVYSQSYPYSQNWTILILTEFLFIAIPFLYRT